MAPAQKVQALFRHEKPHELSRFLEGKSESWPCDADLTNRSFALVADSALRAATKQFGDNSLHGCRDDRLY